MQLVDPVLYIKLAATRKLPTPQSLALSITKLLQQDDYRIEDLVRLVQSDPALAGELLKFSNAASFGNIRPIVSLSKAVITLGTRHVGVLVLALSVLHSNRDGQCLEFDYEQYWSHALATAISAQALASYAKINNEENFTAGLLSSVGELALAAIFPERYGEVIAFSEGNIHKQLALEREAFATDHRELTASMLLEWGLPEILVQANYHRGVTDGSEFAEGSRIHGLALALQVASALAEICVSRGVHVAMFTDLYAKATRLGLNTEEFDSIADGIISDWIEWGELLKIKAREIPPFTEMRALWQVRQHTTDKEC